MPVSRSARLASRESLIRWRHGGCHRSFAIDQPLRDARRLAHLPEPDYSRPLLVLSDTHRQRMLDLLTLMYGSSAPLPRWSRNSSASCVSTTHTSPVAHRDRCRLPGRQSFLQRDVVLITYGDLLTTPGSKPLQVLAAFLQRFMRGSINTVHILPVLPLLSDRGSRSSTTRKWTLGSARGTTSPSWPRSSG